MGILDAITTGLTELLSHKTRSMLTMLGVIFGVAAVIAMVSIGEGGKQTMLEQIRLMGNDIVHVKRAAIAGELLSKAQERSPFGLKYSDVAGLQHTLSYAKQVVPIREVFADVKAGDKPVAVKVVGTTQGYDVVTRSHANRGRFLMKNDVEDRLPVCVLGAAAKRELFGFSNPLGHTVKIEHRIFKVVGQMEPKDIGAAKALSALRDINSDIYIPITVAIDNFQIYSMQAMPVTMANVLKMRRSLRSRPSIDNSAVSEIIFQVDDDVATIPTAAVIRSALNRSHKGIRDYEIVIPAELLRQSQQTQHIFNIIMAAIASISLLVGGIGIMNIMLATVTQRTREIGVRRCIGATRWDIIRQFMLEALVITCVGGIIGVGLGVAGAHAISVLASWRTVVSVEAIVISFGVSALVGVVFGMYPAIRAASVDPIEALRYS